VACGSSLACFHSSEQWKESAAFGYKTDLIYWQGQRVCNALLKKQQNLSKRITSTTLIQTQAIGVDGGALPLILDDHTPWEKVGKCEEKAIQVFVLDVVITPGSSPMMNPTSLYDFFLTKFSPNFTLKNMISTYTKDCS
jgi:hypothetical protein